MGRVGAVPVRFAAHRGANCGVVDDDGDQLAVAYNSSPSAAFIAGTRLWASSFAACLVSFAANRGVYCGETGRLANCAKDGSHSPL